MIELFLIRHGQTDYSLANRFCGHIDPPLNATGHRMAAAFGLHYGSLKWDAIYTSPMIRTRQTAAALATRVGVEPRVDEGLREVGYGDWEGLGHDEAKARWPEVYAYWAEDTASRATPGGETAFQVAARAAPVIERARREMNVEHPEGSRVLLVSHKATIRILVCALLGMDVRLFRTRIAQPVAAVTRFELGTQGPLLTMHGDVSHLPPELREIGGT